MTKSLTGNEAAALAIRQVNPGVVSAYPITPVTEIMQIISRYISDRKMQTELVLAESEHSAISVCVGAAASGVLTVTATASQGLLYMHEILPIASGLRLPIVMIVGNRAISAPINIHNDHSDTMAVKDSGWLQFYAENPQEAYDLTILAFKISQILRLPIMVCMDGFITTHEMAKINILSNKEVKKFIGKIKLNNSLFNFDKPETLGYLALPSHYMDFRLDLSKAIENSVKEIQKIFDDYNQKFSKNYQLIEEYGLESSKIVVVAMSSLCGTIKELIDNNILKNIGLLKITTFRPLPQQQLVNLLKDKEKIIVLDKSLTFVGEENGNLFEEVRNSLFESKNKLEVFSEVVGLGGKAVYPNDLEQIIKKYDGK